MAIFEQNLNSVGFIEKLLKDVAQNKQVEKPVPVDVAIMSLNEVIEHAIDAIWDFVPTPGVLREHIDFNFATEYEIKKWLAKNYSLFYYNSKD